MKTEAKSIRQSVSLPSNTAARVRHLAAKRNSSASRVLVDLIEAGLRSKETEKDRFFALTDQLAQTSSPSERRKIKKELARMTFGS